MGAAPTKDGAPPAPTTGGRRASVAVKAVIQFHKLTHSPEIATPTAGLAPLAEEGASSEPPPSAPKTAPKTVAASKGQHIASALTYGARVMKDPPTNVFGPGHVVSPDMYADLHKTGPYDRFLLAFQKLEGEERLSAFVTYVYFQGKMGLLLRLCDSFCAADNMLGLFGILKEAATQVLALEHCRLWQVDRKRNVVVCVYHDGDDDAQNGRVLPSLGSFAGDVARNKKVVVCNAAREDSRFGSWQYKEMQERLREPLGSIMGVALLNAANEAQWVLECYTKDDRLLDGADAFLLQTLGDYASSAAEAIRVRWEGQRIASLPALLLDAISLSGFVEQLRPKLCEWFGCADAEIFLYDDDDASLWVHANREAAAAMDQRVRRASVTDRVWRQKAARRTVPLRGGGIAADVARQAKEKGQPVIALSENAAREKAYDANVDGHHRQLLTAAVLSADSQRTSRAGESTSIVAVIQLRDRRWRPPPPPPMRRGGASAQPDAPVTGEAAKEAAKLSAFTSLDVAWFEALRPQLCQALKTALHKELNQQTVYKARMADRRAMAIMNVTNSIAREVELDELFPCVVQEMISLLNCDRATMWVLTSDKSKLWSMVQPANARRGAALLRLEVPISPSSILGSAVLNGEPINLTDVYEDPRFDQKYDKQTGYRTRSMLSMPLIDMKTEDVVGCLQVLNKQDAMGQPEGQSFDDTDLHLAKSFASIVAVGIEQAKFNQASDSAVGMAIKAENKR